MNVPTIQIETTRALLAWMEEKPPVSIRQPPADLQIRQYHMDTIEISQEAAKVYIDQSEAFEDAGLVPPLKSSHEWLNEMKQTVFSYIQKKMEEGKQLRAIELNGGGGKVIASLAKENGKIFEFDVTLAWIPENMFKVTFDVDTGHLSFHAPRKEPDISVQKNDPEIVAPRWRINYYLAQRGSIEFSVQGNYVDQTL